MYLYTANSTTGDAVTLAGLYVETYVQRVDTAEESLDSGLPVGAFANVVVQHHLSDFNGYSDDLLARWGVTRSVVADPPAPIPDEVPMDKARLTLLKHDLLDMVEAAVANATAEAKIEWEYAPKLVRNSGLVQTLANAIGLTSDQIDALVSEAAALP